VLSPADGGSSDREQQYALPFISPLAGPFGDDGVTSHVVNEKEYDASVGSFGEGDHVSVLFETPERALRDDGRAIRAEVWEGRIVDIDTSNGAYESIHVLWYERELPSGEWFLDGVQNDTFISPWQCRPSAEHARYVEAFGAFPACRRIVYTRRGRNVSTAFDDKIDLEPKNATLGELVRVAHLRLSTLECSRAFLWPVEASETEYHARVKEPISLQEIARKASKYTTFDEFARDVDKLIDNAIVGNEDDTLVFHQARELNKEWARIKEAFVPLLAA
jgi:hypothetical protein